MGYSVQATKTCEPDLLDRAINWYFKRLDNYCQKQSGVFFPPIIG